MPCNINVICFIDQYNEVPGKSNFVVNAIGVVNPQYKSDNVYIHIVSFYPIDNTRNNDLEKFEKGNIVQVQGRFSIIETNIDEEKIKMIKVK
jgi:hypothetical protein